MKRFVLSLLILVSCSSTFSQKLYFLYFQSENEQPFFLKLNEKVHSSSATGYLLIARLHDSSYHFTIGFPQNKFPEQRFTVDIRGKDHGYLIKNFGQKGWGLFDLQTLAIQMALPDTRSGAIKTEPRDDISPFTEILAKAANDPSLKERPIAVKMEDKPVPVQSAVLKETVSLPAEPAVPKRDSQSVVKKDEPPKIKKEQQPVMGKTEPASGKPDSESVVKKDVAVRKEKEQAVVNKTEPPPVKRDTGTIKTEPAPVVKTVQQPAREDSEKIKETGKAPATEYKRSVVAKRSESSTSEGLGLVFIDEFADGKKDTIRIIIPDPRTNSAGVKGQPREERRFLDIEDRDTGKQIVPEAKVIPVNNQASNAGKNVNCPSIASDNDFLKLQKKMMGEKSDERMIDEAKKVFKSRCFTTVQLKTLSILFISDNGKYKFFDAAYQYASDTENFPSLAAELKDEYYINRFRAMLH